MTFFLFILSNIAMDFRVLAIRENLRKRFCSQELTGKQKLQSSLEASVLEVEDVSYQHAGHAAVKDNANNETHFNVKIVSSKFDGQSLVKRHPMVYDLMNEELQSGLHALSIVAKTPQKTGRG